VAIAVLVWKQFYRRPLGAGVPISGGVAMNTRIAAPLFKGGRVPHAGSQWSIADIVEE
jgi:hypothetical protein